MIVHSRDLACLSEKIVRTCGDLFCLLAPMALEPTFKCELNSVATDENTDVLRIFLASDGDSYECLASYSKATNTSWIVDWETPDLTAICLLATL